MKKIIIKLLKTITMVAYLMYAGITIYSQQVEIEEIDKKNAGIQKEIELVEAKIEELEEEESELSSDAFIEKFAKTELGMIKENEYLIVGISG